jgi:hypothetical protein
MYADDSTIHISGENISDIQKRVKHFLLNPYISSFLAMTSWSTTSKAFF